MPTDQQPPPVRVGIGYDVHRLTSDRPLILGGVTVPHEYGLAGHSDADVVVHAICDALLGAVAQGDLGQHFPDTAEQWKHADSLQLLAKVAAVVRREGYEVGNVDATVVCEEPKLSPYISTMREKIAGALEAATSAVSVKATTTEHLGFTGREEGIAAHAVCLVRAAKQ